MSTDLTHRKTARGAGAAFNRNAFDLTQIEKFKYAVLNRDCDAMSHALASGVKSDTPVVNDLHALQVLLFDVSAKPIKHPRYPEDMSSPEFDFETGAMVERLLESGVDLIAREKYAAQYQTVLADHMLGSPRWAEASSVVLQAMLQTLERRAGKETYRPKLHDFVLSFVEEREKIGDKDRIAGISAALRQFAGLHDTVRARLESPQTAVEKELVARHAKKILFWTKKFDVPPIKLFLRDLARRDENAEMEEMGRQGMPFANIMSMMGVNPVVQTEKKTESEVDKYITILPKASPDEVLEKIGATIGLSQYKEHLQDRTIRQQFNKALEAFGLKSPNKTMHIALTGNPGVGKTMLARLDAEYQYAMKRCGPRFAEVSRTKMVGKFIGATDANIREILEKADYVFVDEAHQLVAAKGASEKDKQDFGFRVAEALIPFMENERADKIAAVGAYDLQSLLDSDFGFRSRFGRFYHLQDPNSEDAKAIFRQQLAANNIFHADDAVVQYVMDRMQEAKKTLGPKFFGNSRVSRTIAESLPDILAKRLFGPNGLVVAQPQSAASDLKTVMTTLTLEDVMKLDYPSLTGINGKKPDDDNGSGYADTRIGFTAPVLGRR